MSTYGGDAANARTGVVTNASNPNYSVPADSGASQTKVDSAQVQTQRDLTVRQAVPPRRYVYGYCKIGGAVFFQENINPYLYMGVALSDGVIESIDRIFIGESEVELSGTTAALGTIYYNNLYIEYTDGEPDEVASTMLLAAFDANAPVELTADFRQRGVARADLRLYYGDDSDEHNALWGDGVTPSYMVKGVRFYDPRDIYCALVDESTWSYSANPPLAVAHALTHAWGVPQSSDDIDWDSFSSCATLCDANITYDGGSVKTYEIAGVFQAGADIGSQIVAMLACFGGVLIDVEGKIGCAMDEGRSSVWTVTDDDIIEFRNYAHTGPYENTYNAVKARYFDSDDSGNEKTTPVYEMLYEQATEGLRETSLDLRFCARSHSAQILAYKELMRSRAGRTLTLVLSDAAMYLQVLDRITLASVDGALFNGDYEVVQLDPEQIGVIVQLREYATAAYAAPSTYLV